jgi:hypothetical protein
MSSTAIPPLPPGYQLDQQDGNEGSSAIPPLPPGYKLDQRSTVNHPPLPPGYKLDQPAQRSPQTVSQTAQGEADKPGFSQRWAEGMSIPVTQEQEDAMREEMKPKWYDVVAPGWGRGAKMVGGMAVNAAEQAYQGGKEAYQEGQNIKTQADVIPALTRAYVSEQEHLTRALPGGEQLWNFGQDVHEGNWRGAAGGASAAFLQAALGDAVLGEGPGGRTVPRSGAQTQVAALPRAPVLDAATPSTPPTVPIEDIATTPRPPTNPLEQPSRTQQSSTAEVPKRPLTHRADVKQFQSENPALRGKVVVHHAIEKQAVKRYPGVITKGIVHTGENLRGIPKEATRLHLSQIRREWDEFYFEHPNATEAQVRAKAAEIDAKYAAQFLPPKRVKR